jgi:type I restriction enzyme, R subunit
MDITGNFGFLAEHDPLFVELASTAERAFSSDLNTTLIKLRQLGEALAQHLAARAGIEFDEQTSQADLLYRLQRELRLEPVVRELFHTQSVEGNKATHQFKTRHKEAIKGLIVARDLAIWFHRTFGKNTRQFKPGPFVPPADPGGPARPPRQTTAARSHPRPRIRQRALRRPGRRQPTRQGIERTARSGAGRVG